MRGGGGLAGVAEWALQAQVEGPPQTLLLTTADFQPLSPHLLALLGNCSTFVLLPPPPRLATRLWNWDVTPGSIVRCFGPWGPGLTAKYCRSRFTRQQQLNEAEVAALEQVGSYTIKASASRELGGPFG